MMCAQSTFMSIVFCFCTIWDEIDKLGNGDHRVIIFCCVPVYLLIQLIPENIVCNYIFQRTLFVIIFCRVPVYLLIQLIPENTVDSREHCLSVIQ